VWVQSLVLAIALLAGLSPLPAEAEASAPRESVTALSQLVALQVVPGAKAATTDALPSEIPLFPGARAMLGALRERGHILAIATGKSRAGLARALENTGLRPFFAASRCADQCAPKPAPDMLRELMEELDVGDTKTLMIGDTVHDLKMAAHAGVPAVGVSHGAHPKRDLAALEPLACVENIEELTQWLAQNA